MSALHVFRFSLLLAATRMNDKDWSFWRQLMAEWAEAKHIAWVERMRIRGKKAFRKSTGR
jgi:hypothetical protein